MAGGGHSALGARSAAWRSSIKTPRTDLINEAATTASLALSQLRRQLAWIAAYWLVLWLTGYFLLAAQWPYAVRWLLLSGLTLTAILWRVWRHLDLNSRPEGGPLLPVLGTGNQITLLRGFLLALLAGFLFSPWPQGMVAWAIAGIYTAASIGDGLDGYIARRRGQVTKLGQWLDMDFDGLGVAIVTVLAVGYGQLPGWFLLVGFARYLFLFGQWWRERHGRMVFELAGSVHRRILAGMLMGMMTVVLWPILPAQMAHIAAAVIGIPLLAGFLRDWLLASGRLQEDNPSYQRLRQFAFLLLTRWLPPLLRFLLAGSMIGVLRSTDPWYQPAAWENLINTWGLPGAGPLASLLVLTAVAGTILIMFGVAARLWAILLLFPIGFSMSTTGATWANSLSLICALLITFFGSGPYSLWQPEEALLVQEDGERHEEPVRPPGPSAG